MKALFETNQIEKLLKDFYTVTNQRVGIFDRDFNVIYEYPKQCCEFCTKIRSSKDGIKACRKCDLEGMLAASRGKTIRYRCHAGLLEVCAPITDDMGIIGYFMFGQVLDDSDASVQYAYCRKHAMQYFGNEFDSYFQTLQIITSDYLDSVDNIMSACVGYIYLKKLISFSHGGLWGQMDYYIERNFSRNITLETMANELNVSISSLCKTAKAKTGMTVNEIITKKRVEQAKLLLKSTNKSICEISAAVGISDYNYFSRLFRRLEGTTPGKYRKSI